MVTALLTLSFIVLSIMVSFLFNVIQNQKAERRHDAQAILFFLQRTRLAMTSAKEAELILKSDNNRTVLSIQTTDVKVTVGWPTAAVQKPDADDTVGFARTVEGTCADINSHKTTFRLAEDGEGKKEMRHKRGVLYTLSILTGTLRMERTTTQRGRLCTNARTYSAHKETLDRIFYIAQCKAASCRLNKSKN